MQIDVLEVLESMDIVSESFQKLFPKEAEMYRMYHLRRDF